jgi:zinc resistance-associated protein
MKSRLTVLSLAVAALLAVSSLALAQPYGPHAWLAGVPQEKQEQVAKLYSEGRQKLYELESRKWAKQAELNALLASPKPDSSKIEALAKEIGNLSSMVYQERVGLQQRILKETGVNIPLAEGPGMGGGCGGGYGTAGCPMASGYGPGGCPMARGGFGPQGGNQSALPPCCQTPGQAPGQTPGQTQ